jgi:hypothetical protein
MAATPRLTLDHLDEDPMLQHDQLLEEIQRDPTHHGFHEWRHKRKPIGQFTPPGQILKQRPDTPGAPAKKDGSTSTTDDAIIVYDSDPDDVRDSESPDREPEEDIDLLDWIKEDENGYYSYIECFHEGVKRRREREVALAVKRRQKEEKESTFLLSLLRDNSPVFSPERTLSKHLKKTPKRQLIMQYSGLVPL